MQNVNWQKKGKTGRHSPQPRSRHPFPHALLSPTQAEPPPPALAPQSARAAKTKAPRENSTFPAALRESPRPRAEAGRHRRRRGGTCAGGPSRRADGELPAAYLRRRAGGAA